MKRRYLILILIYSCALCVVSVHRAVTLFSNSSPASMTGSPRWDDELSQAILFAIIAGACVVYGVRTRGRVLPGSTVPKSRWRDRPELRFVLYSYAIMMFIGIPRDVMQAVVVASRSPSPASPYRTTFLSSLRLESVPFAALGIAAIVYDRYRIRRDSRVEGNQCLVCGYDLRATPARCPECGTEVSQLK